MKILVQTQGPPSGREELALGKAALRDQGHILEQAGCNRGNMQLCHEWPPGKQRYRKKIRRNVSCTAQGESADLVDEEKGGHASIDEI